MTSNQPRAAEIANAAPGTLPTYERISVQVTPTQVRRPWRSTARTVFQAFLGLCVLAPLLVQAAGVDVEQLPWLFAVLGVAAAVTRIMALPGVEQWLQHYVSFLAAAPAARGEHRRDDDGATTFQAVGASVLIFALVAALLLVLPSTR